jgi:hypothetical protein
VTGNDGPGTRPQEGVSTADFFSNLSDNPLNELSASLAAALWADEFPWVPAAPLGWVREGFLAREKRTLLSSHQKAGTTTLLSRMDSAAASLSPFFCQTRAPGTPRLRSLQTVSDRLE